jgi:octanoyl-[GcvH]:protein N-octanoyltransferase
MTMERLRVFDHSREPMTGDPLLAFAFEELLGREVGEGGTVSVHLWRHTSACILGMRDRKLPHAVEAMAKLASDGIATVVRHSGGAAVPLDAGVWNVSLVLPMAPGEGQFKQDFDLLTSLLRNTCQALGMPEIAVGEISGSYCPGEYDLSIAGRKFCGMAQRRQTKAKIVHAFLLVEGNGAARARIAKRFYDAAGGDILHVREDRMGALAEWREDVSVEQFQQAFLQQLQRLYSIEQIDPSWQFNDSTLFEQCEALRSKFDN